MDEVLSMIKLRATTLLHMVHLLALSGLSVMHASHANGSIDTLPTIKSTTFDPASVTWSQLSFKASKFGLSLKADVSLRHLDDEEIKADLIQADQGEAIRPGKGEVYLLKLSSRSTKVIHTQLWFSTDTAAALQRIRFDETKGDKRYRIYRYTRGGIFRINKKPAAGEESESHSKWTDSGTLFQAFPQTDIDGMIVTEPLSLLYMGSVAPLVNSGDSVQVLAFFDDRLHVIEMTLAGIKTIDVDFDVVQKGVLRRIKGKRDTLQLLLSSRSFDQKNSKSELTLAGLKGNIKILIDEALRVPVELRGSAGFAGTVKLRLKKAVLLDKEQEQ